jgi:hypothetical protein
MTGPLPKGCWGYKEQIHPNNCDKCEYGDIELHCVRLCHKMIEGDTMEINADEWQFIKRMGCATFEKVREGNPRRYP